MSGSFADAHIDPEYRNTLAAGLFASSRPTGPGFSRIQRSVPPHANFRSGRLHTLTLACSSKTRPRERVHR